MFVHKMRTTDNFSRTNKSFSFYKMSTIRILFSRLHALIQPQLSVYISKKFSQLLIMGRCELNVEVWMFPSAVLLVKALRAVGELMWVHGSSAFVNGRMAETRKQTKISMILLVVLFYIFSEKRNSKL